MGPRRNHGDGKDPSRGRQPDRRRVNQYVRQPALTTLNIHRRAEKHQEKQKGNDCGRHRPQRKSDFNETTTKRNGIGRLNGPSKHQKTNTSACKNREAALKAASEKKQTSGLNASKKQ